jgi:hypothetical protein
MCGSRRERRAWQQHVKGVHDTRREMMRGAALLSLGDVRGKLHAAAVHMNHSIYGEGMAKESPLAILFLWITCGTIGGTRSSTVLPTASSTNIELKAIAFATVEIERTLRVNGKPESLERLHDTICPGAPCGTARFTG